MLSLYVNVAGLLNENVPFFPRRNRYQQIIRMKHIGVARTSLVFRIGMIMKYVNICILIVIDCIVTLRH